MGDRGVWRDDPHEREAEATVSEFASDAEVQRRWQEHPAIVPVRVVARFIGRNAKRVLVTIAGILVVLVGLALVPLPGPGWLIVFGGLAILGTEYVWAQRLLRYAHRRVGQVRDAISRKKPEES